MNFCRSGAHGTAVSFLKKVPLFFSSFLHHIFSSFSCQFVFVMQPNDAKAKKQHYFKVARTSPCCETLFDSIYIYIYIYLFIFIIIIIIIIIINNTLQNTHTEDEKEQR